MSRGAIYVHVASASTYVIVMSRGAIYVHVVSARAHRLLFVSLVEPQRLLFVSLIEP